MQHTSFPFQAIIFDMDGTLLESTEADYLAWQKVFAHYGKPLTYADYVPLLGIRSADVIKNYLGFPAKEDVTRILVEKFDRFVDVVNEQPVKIVTGAEAFLRQVRTFPIKTALATSSRKEKTELLLTRLNLLQYFDAIVTGEEVPNSKPAPDIFLKAAEKLGADPLHCIVVEDGPIGVEGAKRAGMKCLAVTATNPAEKLTHADVIIDSYDEIDFEELCRRMQASAR